MLASVAEPLKTDDSVEVFCSYSHRDEPLRKEFESSVAMLRRQKLVQIWHDRQIAAGEDWAGDIDEHLNSADIITLFVSADFLASDYCYEKELSRALEREERKEALVLPIIVRPCDWNDAPFAYLQAVPSGAKAVTSWENRDEAWTDVAKSLKLTVRKVLTAKLARLKEKVAPPAEIFESVAADGAKARQIYQQILRDAEAFRPQQERIMAQMQAKIFALNEELGPAPLAPKKRVSDSLKDIDKYIRG
jgi:hypothetical protein